MLAVLAGTAFTAVPATAGANENDFSCRASAVRVQLLGLLNLEPFVANRNDRPCNDGHEGVLAPTTIGPVTASALNANTDNGDNDRAHADAHVAKVRIAIAGIPTITADVLASSADMTCVNGQPQFTSDSDVVNLKIGGTTIKVPDGEAKVVNAGLLAKLTLNEIDTTPTSAGEQRLTRRALHLTSAALNTDIVIAESTVNVHDDACAAAPPPPECSDGKDNEDPEDAGDPLADALDPGCHTDGDPNNPGSYDPTDEDETDKPECSDGGDNDGNGDPDALDPDCHTDGDPDNPESYNPNDDSESGDDKPQCSDGIDNDGKDGEDIRDPECHYDGDPNNAHTYVPGHDDESVGATKP